MYNVKTELHLLLIYTIIYRISNEKVNCFAMICIIKSSTKKRELNWIEHTRAHARTHVRTHTHIWTFITNSLNSPTIGRCSKKLILDRAVEPAVLFIEFYLFNHTITLQIKCIATGNEHYYTSKTTAKPSPILSMPS